MCTCKKEAKTPASIKICIIFSIMNWYVYEKYNYITKHFCTSRDDISSVYYFRGFKYNHYDIDSSWILRSLHLPVLMWRSDISASYKSESQRISTVTFTLAIGQLFNCNLPVALITELVWADLSPSISPWNK